MIAALLWAALTALSLAALRQRRIGMNDDIILVDIFDSKIGHTDKDDAHRRGLLHRAFSVFVIHDGRMLIQKRSRDKYHSGGLWTNACCSHPREGESLDQAVPRRMREELGFSSRAEELFSFVYRHVFSDGLVEYEFDHVFLADYDGEYVLNRDEAEDAAWIALDELAEDLRIHPERYTVWFQTAAPKVLGIIKANAHTD